MHRLSQAEIDRMVQEAVKFRAEDECLVDGTDAETTYAGFLEFKVASTAIKLDLSRSSRACRQTQSC